MHDRVPDFLRKSNPKPTHQYDLFAVGGEFSRRARRTIRGKIKFSPKTKSAPATAARPFNDSLEGI
jgi:hypothetical protein